MNTTPPAASKGTLTPPPPPANPSDQPNKSETPQPVQTPPSVKVYFSKALLSNQIMVAGKCPAWEPLDGNQGVIMLDSVADAAMIAGLEEYVTRQSGGVLKSSSIEYEELKKNHPWKPRGAKSWLDEPLKLAGRKGYRPAEPKPSIAKHANGADTPPAPPASGEVPQRPPDQPDFKTGSFTPATSRLPEPANTERT